MHLWVAEVLLAMPTQPTGCQCGQCHPHNVASCVLHNICENKGEYFRTERAQDRTGVQTLYSQHDPVNVHAGAGSQQAREIQDAIHACILEQQAESPQPGPKLSTKPCTGAVKRQ